MYTSDELSNERNAVSKKSLNSPVLSILVTSGFPNNIDISDIDTKIGAKFIFF